MNPKAWDLRNANRTQYVGALGSVSNEGIVHEVRWHVASHIDNYVVCACGSRFPAECLDDKPRLVTCIACAIAKPESVGWI